MDDQNTREIYRKRLEEKINKVPERIRNGSIQDTRHWMKQRDAAIKIMKKPNVTVTQLMTALQMIE